MLRIFRKLIIYFRLRSGSCGAGFRPILRAVSSGLPAVKLQPALYPDDLHLEVFAAEAGAGSAVRQFLQGEVRFVPEADQFCRKGKETLSIVLRSFQEKFIRDNFIHRVLFFRFFSFEFPDQSAAAGDREVCPFQHFPPDPVQGTIYGQYDRDRVFPESFRKACLRVFVRSSGKKGISFSRHGHTSDLRAYRGLLKGFRKNARSCLCICFSFPNDPQYLFHPPHPPSFMNSFKTAPLCPLTLSCRLFRTGRGYNVPQPGARLPAEIVLRNFSPDQNHTPPGKNHSLSPFPASGSQHRQQKYGASASGM